MLREGLIATNFAHHKMVKRTAKYGFKSGILPKRRDPLVRPRPSWIVKKEAETPSGFSDPSMVPKGAQLKPQQKLAKDVAELIRDTAKEPKNLSERSEEQKYKNMISAMRRKYYVDSLETQKAMNEKQWERNERRHREGLEAHENLIQNSEESIATRLTLPTVEAFLDGPFVQPRTAEETALLKLKREANRKAFNLKIKEAQATGLLRLYYQAENFITTEEVLNAKVDQLFAQDIRTDTRGMRLNSLLGGGSDSDKVTRENLLVEALTGKFAGKEGRQPGLQVVREVLENPSENVADRTTEKPSE